MKTMFICPECNARVSADDSYIGRNVRCPKCSAKFLLSVDNAAKAEPARSSGPTTSPTTSAATSSSSANDVDDLIGSIKQELRQEEVSKQSAAKAAALNGGYEESSSVLAAFSTGSAQKVNPFIPISPTEASRLFGEEVLSPGTSHSGRTGVDGSNPFGFPREPAFEISPSPGSGKPQASTWAQFFTGDERTTYGLRNKMIISTLLSNLFFFGFLIFTVAMCEKGERFDPVNASSAWKSCILLWIVWKIVNLYYLSVLAKAEYGTAGILRVLSPRRVFIMLMSAGSAPNPYYRDKLQQKGSGAYTNSQNYTPKVSRPLYKSPLIITVCVLGIIIAAFMYSVYLLHVMNENKKKEPKSVPMETVQANTPGVTSGEQTKQASQPHDQRLRRRDNAPNLPPEIVEHRRRAEAAMRTGSKQPQRDLAAEQRREMELDLKMTDLFMSTPFMTQTPNGRKIDLMRIPDCMLKSLLTSFNADGDQFLSAKELDSLLKTTPEEKLKPMIDEAKAQVVKNTKTQARMAQMQKERVQNVPTQTTPPEKKTETASPSIPNPVPEIPRPVPASQGSRMSLSTRVNGKPVSITSTDPRGISIEEMKKAGFPQNTIDENAAFDADKDGYVSLPELATKHKASLEKFKDRQRSRLPKRP